MGPEDQYLWWSWFQSDPPWRSHRWWWRSRPGPRRPAWVLAHSWTRCWGGLPDRRKNSRGTIPSYIWKSINASETEIKVDACFAHTSGVGDDIAKAMVAKIKNVLKPILGIKRSAVLVKEFGFDQVPLSPTESLWLPTRWHQCHFNRSPSQNTALLLSGY